MEDNTVNQEEKLDLNTESIKERTGTYSSLTDLNQIPVFSDFFKERKEMTRQEEQAAEQALSESVFYLPVVEKEKNDISEKMFMSTDAEMVIRNTADAADKMQYGTTIAGILAIAVLVAALWIYRKKGNKKNDVNIKSAEIG